VHRFSVATLSMLVTVLATSAAASAAPRAQNTARERLDVYKGVVSADQLRAITALGVDHESLTVSRTGAASGKHAQFRVETILSGRQADALEGKGLDLSLKQIDGASAAQRATAEVHAGLSVFRKYSGPGGLQQEFQQIAAQNPKLTKLLNIGKTVNGQDILALKISKDAKTKQDGKKPAVLYLGAQHAREWITPEMVRRLARYFISNYSSNSTIRRLVDDNELWFVPVANPDGYDFTFEDGQRMWRKNLHDNNGDGQITAVDGVDPNRNFPTKWGYDNEGSSPDFTSETYRGTGPASEPETKALDSLARRVGFEFVVDYHSAAELLLYGVGWQVATPTPDDVLYEAMAGDDATPAIPGYDPDISAELYTTNGETDGDLQERYHALAFTPEMSTCQDAAARDPEDDFDPADCGSVFDFPDSEPLIQGEFEKNIPFALSVAKSAKDPDDPVSAVGRTAENFRVDSFDVSYGDPQKVAVVAKRAIQLVTMQYRINGGFPRISTAPEWQGGERYGDENDDYYVERRGTVRGTHVGDKVEVWFTGIKTGGGLGLVSSRHFTYKVEKNSGADVLVIANEDRTGVNPEPTPPGGPPKYLAEHVAAVQAAGHQADVWNVDTQGVPHDLGVLSHYKAVVWYLGDNRITQDPEDALTTTYLGELPDIAVAERQQYLTMAVRDYLNEGGKLIHDGETTQYQGLPGISDAVGGLFYGLNGDPSAECEVDDDFFSDCLILADDFRQYYLGAFTRTSIADPAAVAGVATPLIGFSATLRGPVVAGDNPLDEAGSFQPTSDVLPPAQFPQFTSHGSAEYEVAGVNPYAPVEGTRYAAAVHADNSYMRLTRTIDLTSATAAQLQFQLSLNSEENYDHFIVEAHTVGMDNWTTLAEIGGATSTARPAECSIPGFLVDLHPFLTHYFSGADCSGPGSTGAWNSITGSTGGWVPVAYDLSAFFGQQVEVSLTYVTDPNTGGVGAFVDDTRVVVNGVTSADGFEGTTSAWAVGATPPDSPPPAGNWVIGPNQVNSFAATSTDDTLLLGFGLEQLSTDAERNQLMDKALAGLIE
jgi:predicted deacylase